MKKPNGDLIHTIRSLQWIVAIVVVLLGCIVSLLGFTQLESIFTKVSELKFSTDTLRWRAPDNNTIQPIDPDKLYKVCTCEREGDPDNVLCRLGDVQKPTLLGADMHQTIIEYLKTHSPVAPHVEGRVTATDAPPTLLSQLEGFGYEFF